jgi:uncharacterized protein (TIGR02453 family)
MEVRGTGPLFTPATLAFLRALKRHNDRDWFRANRERYERDVRSPMIRAVERLALDLPRFAPDLAASPRISLYRIHRDTRFSPDKSPFKTQIAAVFPCRRLPKHEGAGLYYEIGPGGVWMGGGMYAPQTPQLQAVREHIARRFRQLQRLLGSAAFRRRVGRVEGQRLQRVPRGFAADHPAAELLKLRQFLMGRDYPAAFATSARFYPTLIAVFEAIAPVVRFLNEPLLTSQPASSDMHRSPARPADRHPSPR